MLKDFSRFTIFGLKLPLSKKSRNLYSVTSSRRYERITSQLFIFLLFYTSEILSLFHIIALTFRVIFTNIWVKRIFEILDSRTLKKRTFKLLHLSFIQGVCSYAEAFLLFQPTPAQSSS